MRRRPATPPRTRRRRRRRRRAAAAAAATAAAATAAAMTTQAAVTRKAACPPRSRRRRSELPGRDADELSLAILLSYCCLGDRREVSEHGVARLMDCGKKGRRGGTVARRQRVCGHAGGAALRAAGVLALATRWHASYTVPAKSLQEQRSARRRAHAEAKAALALAAADADAEERTSPLHSLPYELDLGLHRGRLRSSGIYASWTLAARKRTTGSGELVLLSCAAASHKRSQTTLHFACKQTPLATRVPAGCAPVFEPAACAA
jgi:hypothetical protein